MCQEECRLFPDFGYQFIEVIGCRRAAPGLDLLRVGGMRQKPVFLVVDQFAFLALFHRFDGQAKLLLDLVVRDAVEIRNAGMHVEHRLYGAE